VQPLQSVNCHDRRAHGHERHGPSTRLVRGYGWDGSGWVIGSSRFGLWYVVGVKPVCMVVSLATAGIPVSSIGLATGGMPMSVGQFGYRCDSCELVALGYSWVTLVQCHA
jgi:hypothetical protein